MTRVLALLSIVALASCGADGDPVRPTAGANVTVTEDGVSTSGTVGVVRGPLTVSLGF